MTTPTLNYDDLPSGSDLSHEFTATGVTITAARREPSPRAVAWARRRAAARAAGDTAIVGLIGIALLLLLPVYTPRRAILPLPIAVYPLLGVLAGAVFLMAWQARCGQCLDALHVARRQVTVIVADAESLRVETEGPLGKQSICVAAGEVARVEAMCYAKRPWVSMERWVMRVTLREGREIDLLAGREIDLLAGRDESELAWVAAVVRRVLNAPEPAMVPSRGRKP